MIELNNYLSWGRYPKYYPKNVLHMSWRNEKPNLQNLDSTVLPYAFGKSYGDSCLNKDGYLVDIKRLNHFIEFDQINGTLKCEAGVTLDKILKLIIPYNYFLPVTPGTKHISIAGAIANDVHGKNHHINGTIGCYVQEFELLRSNGEVLTCNEKINSDLFKATIGGLGLTGIITTAKIKLKNIPGIFIDAEFIKFDNLDEFFAINYESEQKFEYTVAWVDASFPFGCNPRGIYIRGNHTAYKETKKLQHKELKIPFPFELKLMNNFTTSLLNSIYYNKQIFREEKKIIHYNKFFYPLDGINNWNFAYGKNGFIQYQIVIPIEDGAFVIKDIMKIIHQSNKKSFMTVLKTFGDKKSPGLMSFPRKGITLAIDFPMDGKETLEMLNRLDSIVREVGGGHYPAKDSRMNPMDFKRFYPQWEYFSKFIDEKFSSSFWRRVSK